MQQELAILYIDDYKPIYFKISILVENNKNACRY